MINKIHNIVLNDLKVKARKLAEILFISTERVVNILLRHLCKMGAAIAYNRPKTHSCYHFGEKFGPS